MKIIVISFLIVILSGCVQTKQALLINYPITYNHSGTIVVSEAGLTISAPVRISGKLKITGQGQLHIKRSGRLIVEQNGSLEINGVSIQISELDKIDGPDDGRIIRLNGGRLTLKNNRVNINVAYDPNYIVSHTPWGERPMFWIVGISDIARKTRSSVHADIVSNEFESDNLYSAGALGKV